MFELVVEFLSLCFVSMSQLESIDVVCVLVISRFTLLWMALPILPGALIWATLTVASEQPARQDVILSGNIMPRNGGTQVWLPFSFFDLDLFLMDATCRSVIGVHHLLAVQAAVVHWDSI